MDPFKEEPEIQAEVIKLTKLLEQNETIQRYKQLESKVKKNQRLTELVEKIKQAQKDAVQFEHYDKPEAARQAIASADRLTEEFDQHPLVLAYREQLAETNELLHYLTDMIQREVNQALEEGKYASKN